MLNVKIRNNILKLFIVLTTLSLLFTGCGYTVEELMLIGQYKVVGKANAIKYIQGKYGFTPKVIDVKNEYNEDATVPDFTPMPYGDVMVTMQYQQKVFKVEIDGSAEGANGSDDYQKEEILAYLNSYIKSKYPMVDEVSFPFMEKDYGLFSTYFTGTNFQDYIVPDDYRSQIILKLYDKDVNVFPADDFTKKIPCNQLSIINYKNKNKMPNPEDLGFFSGWKIRDIQPYIKQYKYFERNGDYESDYVEVYSTTYDNMLICTLQDVPVIVEKTKNTYSPDSYYGKCISSYHVQTNAEDVCIYIPKNVITDNQKLYIFACQYGDELLYENEEYYYFDDPYIKDDTDDFESSFSFSCFANNK